MSKTIKPDEGFMCVFTLDRLDELRRFLISYNKHNSTPISIFLAQNIKDAHRLKTLCAFYTPFDYTCLIDIDMLVHENLDAVFDCAYKGKIGICQEQKVPLPDKILNSGLIVFPKELMKEVCLLWNKKYEPSVSKVIDQVKGTWEQWILNITIRKFPHIILPPEFNWVLKEHSVEEDASALETHNPPVKVFHFLHDPGYDRTKYKSYQTFMSL